MKKFQFSLESVLWYKQQTLDALRGEHAALLAAVNQQEMVVERLKQEYHAFNQDYKTRMEEGMSLSEARGCDTALHVQQKTIQKAEQELRKRKRAEEAKRAEVVRAKQDTASIEKLREKKLDAYKKTIQKQEEQFIDEFVSTTRAMAQIGV